MMNLEIVIKVQDEYCNCNCLNKAGLTEVVNLNQEYMECISIRTRIL